MATCLIVLGGCQKGQSSNENAQQPTVKTGEQDRQAVSREELITVLESNNFDRTVAVMNRVNVAHTVSTIGTLSLISWVTLYYNHATNVRDLWLLEIWGDLTGCGDEGPVAAAVQRRASERRPLPDLAGGRRFHAGRNRNYRRTKRADRRRP